METQNGKFGTTFGNYPKFENSEIETLRNKDFQGVFVKNGKSATPETKEGYKLLGYFESWADANKFATFLHSEKGIEPCIMSYNPAQNK